MVNVARYAWYIGSDGTTGLGYWFNLTANTRTNPKGYGYGYWVQGYMSGGSTYFGGAENKGFILMQSRCLPGGADYVSSEYVGFKYRINYTTSANWTGYLSFTLSGFDWKKDVCSKELSDTFETKISVYEPDLPLYDFYDSGEVTIYFGRCKNGYAYEAGAQGGSSGVPEWQDPTSSGSNGRCQLIKDHNGTESVIKDILTIADQTWVPMTIDVQPGDRLILRCGGSTQQGTSGRYCIFWFTHDIPGWKIRD